MKRLAMLISALMIWATVASAIPGSVNAATSGGAGPSNPIQKWKLSANSNYPAVIGKDGMIYLGGDSLYAMTPGGSMKWTAFIGEGGEFSADATPAIGPDNTIYAAFVAKQFSRPIENRDSYLTAFNPDGTLKWKYSTGSLVGSQPAVGPDGTVYISNYNSELFAIKSDGSLKWSTKLGSYIGHGSTVAVSLDGSSIYTQCSKGLCAMSAADGSLKWNDQKTGTSPYAAPNGTIYSLNSLGYLVMDAPDGTQLKMLNLKAQNFTIGKDGTIYAGVGSAMNAFTANGDLIWSVPTASGAGRAVVGSDGTVYFGSSDEHVYAVDAGGSVKWLYFVGTGYAFHYDENRNVSYYELGISPKVALGADGTVYVNSNSLYATPGEEVYSSQMIALGDQGGTPANKRIIPNPSYVKATTGTFEVTVMDEGAYNKEPNVKVNVRDQNGQLMSTGQTDASGKAVLKLSKEGVYAIEIEKEGNQPKPLQARLLLGQTTRIGMQLHSIKGGAIHFTITSTIDQSPITEAQTVLRNLATQAVITSRTDAKGEVYFRNVPEGDYILRAVKDGYNPEESEWVSPRPEQQDFNLEMSPPPATITFVDKNGVPGYVQYHFLTKDMGGTTNGSGIASFYNLPPGTYKLAIVDQNYHDGQVVSFVVTEKQREFQVVLDDNHKVISTGSGATFGDSEDVSQPVKGTGGANEASSSMFSDMNGHWAESQVGRLAGMSILDGFPDGTYKPDESVTREQFVSMMVKTLGYPVDKDALPTFNDVSGDRWSNGAINAALRKGMLLREDYAAGFHPTAAMSRNDMAIMIARALKLAPNAEALFFEDKGSITDHPELVGATVKAQIITGFPDQTFRPNETLTRAQAAIVLINTYETAQASANPDASTHFVSRGATNTVTYSPNVVDLSSQGQLTSLAADGTLTLNSADSKLNNGSIVVLPPSGAYPFGVAKKIVSLTSNGSQTIAKTVDPAFTELIDQIDIQKETPLKLDQLKLTSVPEGISIRKLPKREVAALSTEVQVSNNSDGLEIEMSGLKIKPDEKSNLSIGLSGKLKLGTPKVITDYQYSFFKLKQLQLEFISTDELEAEVNLTAQNEASTSVSYTSNGQYKGFDLKAFEKNLPLGTFFLPVAGPLGVEVSLVLQLKVDASLGVTETVKATFTQDVGLKKEDGEFRPINNSKMEIDAEAKGTGKISAQLGPEVSLGVSILQFASAGLNASFGIQGEAEVSVQEKVGAISETAACYRYGLNWFFEAGAFVKIPLVLDLDFPIVDEKWPILKGKDSCEENQTKAADIQRIEVVPTRITLKPGGKQTVSLKAYTATGAVQDVDLTKIQYTTDRPNLISADATLTIALSNKAKAGDDGQITFLYKGLSVTVAVTVDGTSSENGPTDTSSSENGNIIFQNEQWLWSNPNRAATWKLDKVGNKDVLTITAPIKSKIDPTTDMVPKVTKKVSGDFTFTAHINADTKSTQGKYGAGGLLLKNQTGYVRFEKSTYGDIQMIAANNGAFVKTTYSSSGNKFTDNDVYLKLERKGNQVVGYFSTDGVAWNEVARCSMTLPIENDIGIHVYNDGVIDSSYVSKFSDVRLDTSTGATSPSAAFMKTVRPGIENPISTVTVQPGQKLTITLTNNNLASINQGSVGKPISSANPSGAFVGAFLVNGKYVANNANMVETWFMVDTPEPGRTATMEMTTAVAGVLYIGFNANVTGETGSYNLNVTAK